MAEDAGTARAARPARAEGGMFVFCFLVEVKRYICF
jgi:hypothetical protein